MFMDKIDAANALGVMGYHDMKDGTWVQEEPEAKSSAPSSARGAGDCAGLAP